MKRAHIFAAAVLSLAPLLAAAGTADLGRLLADATNWKADDPRAAEFTKAFCEACASATAGELPSLADTYARSLDAPLGLSRDAIFHAVADVWTRLELAALVAERAEPIAITRSDSLPFRREPPLREDLADALKLHLGLHRHPRLQATEQVPLSRKEEAFLADFARFLGGKLDEPARRFARYDPPGNQWRASATTRLHRAQFMAALRERELATAAGIVMRDTETWSELRARHAPEWDWRAEFLRLCGVDWEELYLGVLVSEWVFREDRQLVSSVPFGTDPALPWLCASGSPRAIEMLLEVFRESWCRERIAPSLAALVPPGENGKPPAGLHRLGAPLPVETTDAILAALTATATDSMPEREAEVLLTEFRRLRRAETAEAARRLLAHWSDRTGILAHTTLTELGGNPPPFTARGPVRFQLLVNGQPAQALAETLHRLQSVHEHGRAEFGDDGIAAVSRERFARPEAANAALVVALRPGFFYKAGNAYDAEFRKNAGTVPFGEVRLEPPISMDQLNRVEITAAPLRIQLAHPRGAAALRGSDTEFVLIGAGRNWSHVFTRPAARELSIALQIGGYKVRLRTRGAAVWESEKFEHGAQGTTLDARLAPGSDVRFRISAEGWPKNYFAWKLEPAPPLADVNDRTPDAKTGLTTLRGVPPGDYKLRVLSLAEASQFSKGRTNYAREPGDPEPYAGKTVEFAVRPDSPALLDLGEIKLDPEK